MTGQSVVGINDKEYCPVIFTHRLQESKEKERAETRQFDEKGKEEYYC